MLHGTKSSTAGGVRVELNCFVDAVYVRSTLRAVGKAVQNMAVLDSWRTMECFLERTMSEGPREIFSTLRILGTVRSTRLVSDPADEDIYVFTYLKIRQ